MTAILWHIPAVQIALLFRQWKTVVAGSKAITLEEEEIAQQRFRSLEG